MKVSGRCHCGAIRYEAELDPATVSLCHCTDCQSMTGSAYRVSVPVPKDAFKLLSGEPKVYIKAADSGNRRAQAFCAECGAPVYSAAEKNAPTYALRVGCLDQRDDLPPRRQIWCQSALAWAIDLHGIPEMERQ